MATFDVDLEIHAPGLDLHHKHWNYHVMFMDEVHRMNRRIGARSWRGYGEHGRGALFVDRDQWMDVIRRRWAEEGDLFPCHYIKDRAPADDVNLEVLRSGFKEMIREYDPERQVVMVVQHHSADLLSCYLFRYEGVTTEALLNEM